MDNFSSRQIGIFGGTGFLGRTLVRMLAPTKAKIKIFCRDAESEAAKSLKVCGEVGQITVISGDITDSSDVAKFCVNTDYIINLLGILYESGNNTFQSIHSETPALIGHYAAFNNVKKLIHISSLGVDENKASKYAITKFNGEKMLLDAYPNAIVIRPSVMFGPEDNFINMFAKMARCMHVVPLIGGGKNKLQPVYVKDVAQLIFAMLESSSLDIYGKIYEVAGPKQYSMKDIISFILHASETRACVVNIPFAVAKLQAWFLEFLPHPPLTRDQILLLRHHNILKPGTKNALKLFDIQPTGMEQVMAPHLK